MKKITHPFSEAVIAKTHGPIYLMHKFWARKPHNVVARYIKYYTNPGDVVLDPFVGSGVTVIEAARLGRKAIGNDLNPIACFITEMTVAPVDITKLKAAFVGVQRAGKDKINSYYFATCSNRHCSKEAIISSVVWKRQKGGLENMLLLKTECPYCGSKEQRKPTNDDLLRYDKIEKEKIPYFYPKDIPLHESAKRSVNFIHELFTKRALMCLSILLNAIREQPDESCREHLLFCFSSNLAQMAKLNSIDMRKGREYSSRGWVIPNYWIPRGFLETNVWNGFAARFSKVVRGKLGAETIQSRAKDVIITNDDATKLRTIKDESIDYIFTDPPYGDSVPYFGLSLMWVAWLQQRDKLDFDREIVISERGDYEEELERYRKLLSKSFSEMFRVLKSGGTVTVTFHNREIRVWNALVSAAFDAGFIYENDNYVLPAVKSSKSQLAKSGSMTGDIYINFRKPRGHPQRRKDTEEDVHPIIIREAKRVILSRNGQATTDQLARGIYSNLIKSNLFRLVADKDVRSLLSSIPLQETMPNVWAFHKTEAETMLQYVPLTKRIEFIIDSVLEGNGKLGYALDDFLIPIFTQLKNGLTPENKEIMDVLRECAYVKNNKWYHAARPGDLFPEYEIPTKCVLPEAELREHEQFIYQMAHLGSSLNYQIWIGKNEQNKSDFLQRLSVRALEIPGLSEKFIANNRIDQIDLIWLDPDQGRYAAFEVENSTGVVPGIQRLCNLTEKMKHLVIPTFVIIPDKFRKKAQKIFESLSGKKLGGLHRKFIVYSKLLHHIDLLENGQIQAEDLLEAISEQA